MGALLSCDCRHRPGASDGRRRNVNAPGEEPGAALSATETGFAGGRGFSTHAQNGHNQRGLPGVDFRAPIYSWRKRSLEPAQYRWGDHLIDLGTVHVELACW